MMIKDNDQEMSMEEILASIRKYVIEDDSSSSKSQSPSESEEEEEIIDLRLVQNGVSHPAENQKPKPQTQGAQTTPIHSTINGAINLESAPTISISTGLTSAKSMTASAQALSNLVETTKSVQEQANATKSPPPPPVDTVTPGLSLEAIAVQAMGPYIKSWLDAHLPALVERLVQTEIKRITEELLKK